MSLKCVSMKAPYLELERFSGAAEAEPGKGREWKALAATSTSCGLGLLLVVKFVKRKGSQHWRS